MKVSILRGGGIGGLLTRTELNSEVLPSGDSRTFADKAQRALALSDAPASGERFPDELLYTIVVDDGNAARTLRFTEQTLPEPVRELIAWVDARPEREDRLETRGAGA